MQYFSTRSKTPTRTLSEAIAAGLAPDGGLYVPERFPTFDSKTINADSLAEMGTLILQPFFEGDRLSPRLPAICARAFNFPIPLVYLKDDTAVLELFQGPTAAFKDVGARFLAQCFGELEATGAQTRRTILVATSGDTGGAVAAAFNNSPVNVAVLFPKNGVSPLQEKQLTCWGDNITAIRVRGTFDDCQRLVKTAFAAENLRKANNLTSANSINIGRLLPQTLYYALSALQYQRKTGAAPGFVIPTGNLGNAVAAFWARQMGFPIRVIALSCNANRFVPDYFNEGKVRPRPSLPTLANAMDVGHPSNMERLLHLIPDPGQLRKIATASSVDNAIIERTIGVGEEEWGRVWCPHTATAVHLREQQDSPHWIVVATAHPAKFLDKVGPLLGREIELPAQLRELMDLPSRCVEIEPTLDALVEAGGFSRVKASF